MSKGKANRQAHRPRRLHLVLHTRATPACAAPRSARRLDLRCSARALAPAPRSTPPTTRRTPMRDEELRELAEGATPGPWEVSRVEDEPLVVVGCDADLLTVHEWSRWPLNAAYIAAASPDRILGLLDRLARVEALADEWHEVVQSIVNNDAPSIRHREVLRSVVIDLRAALSAPTHTEDEGVDRG